MNVVPISYLYFFTGCVLDTSLFGCVVAVLWPLAYHYKRHPVNYFLLAIFTVALAFAVGLTCAFTSGKQFEFFNMFT